MGSSRDAIEPTVLLVGAGERFTPAFQAALGRYRVQVETAELGTVVDAVIVTAPDLVLLMGEAAKDGGAFVLQKLASLSQNFTVPVVVLNDDEELDQKLSAFRHGATAVLPRSASVDATAAEVAKMARDIPEQGSDSQGGLGEATLDEFIGALSRQLRTGLVSSLSNDPESAADLKLVLGRGRPLTEFLDTFVRRVRRHVVRAEPLFYELGESAARDDGLSRVNAPAGRPEIQGLRVVLADDDTPRADAVAQELRSRGVTVVVTDLEPSGLRFQTLRQADPTVLVIGEEHAHGAGYELLRRMRRDSRLRWASLLVVRWNEIWSEERGAPVIQRLESTLAGLVEPERALFARAEARVSFDTRLEATGPARCLRTLGSLAPALRVHVENPRVALVIDLSDGLVVGVEGRTLDAEAKQLSGVNALSALLVLGSGRVRVEPVDQAATANVMTPVEAALNMADAETPPITPSIPAAGTVSLAPPPAADEAPMSLPVSDRGSVRPTPIVPVGAPKAAAAVPRPAPTPAFAPLPPPTRAPLRPATPPAATPPPAAPLLVAAPLLAAPPAAPPPLAAPPPAAPFPLSASAQMSAQSVPTPQAAALGPDLSTRQYERTPPAVTLPATPPQGEASGSWVAGGFAARWDMLGAWFARHDAKLHGKRISRRVAAVLVGLGALQGLALVLLYGGARWLVRPHSAPESPVAAREIVREERRKAAPAPPPSVASEAPGPTAVAPAVSPVRPGTSDGSGHDVPDCKTLLAGDTRHDGFYPGAALQAMRAGRSAIVRGDLPLAQTSLCRAANYNPKNAEIALELSLVLLLQRDGPDAEEWARRAVELDPNELGAQDALGDALARTGNEVEAKRAWLTAARIDPTNEAAVRAIVTRSAKQADKALRRRDLVTAERSFRRAAVLEPRSNASRSGLAYVLLQLGDLEPAVLWARRAVDVAPRNSGARLVLGDALAKSGDKTGAAQEWREAALLDPTNREAQKRLRSAGMTVH